MPPYNKGVCKKHGPNAVMVKRAAYQGYGTVCLLCKREWVTNRRKKMKVYLVERAGGVCVICGYDKCIKALEFHHRDPRDKKFALSAGVLTKSKASLEQEADKCDLVCANCHRELEGVI